jgi:phosphate/sulfate permease
MNRLGAKTWNAWLLAVACCGALFSGVVTAADPASAVPAAGASAASAALAASVPAANAMDDTTKVLLTLVLTPLLGVVAAFYTTRYKLRQERDDDRDKEKEHIRLKILNPLLISAEDLLDRITDIKRRRKDPALGPNMIRWFSEVKGMPRQDLGRLAFWANDEGYFAMSTLYVTAVYFYYAGTIRRDFPFFELASDSESTLLSHLSQVRLSIGGKFGIWETMQDSLGAYLAKDAAVKNYREFCEMVIDEKDAPWLNRLVDFYRDIHMKLDDHLANIEHSLRELIAFLRVNLGIRALEYHLDKESIAQLRTREIPKALIDRLVALHSLDYLGEVDFVAALVERIGQDLTDDYKPSILKYAQKGLA